MTPTLPKTRGECRSLPRPCPFIHCRYHLLVEANDLDGEPTLEETCALDVAEGGGMSAAAIGRVLGYSRANICKIERSALSKLQAFGEAFR